MGHYSDQIDATQREDNLRHNKRLNEVVAQLEKARQKIPSSSSNENQRQARLKIREAILWLRDDVRTV